MSGLVNLAGSAECDEHIREELTRARISIVKGPRLAGEVAATLQGKLGLINFHRAWTYWVAEGPVPIELARELYADPVGRTDIRSGGHCACPHPESYGAKYYDADGVRLYEDPDGREESVPERLKWIENTWRCVVDKKAAAARIVVDVYHIDTEVGLRVFADAIRHMEVREMQEPTKEVEELRRENVELREQIVRLNRQRLPRALAEADRDSLKRLHAENTTLRASLARLTEAAGCPDEENFESIVSRVHDSLVTIVETHRPVTPAEGGADMCGDCGADIEDAIQEARLCPAYSRRQFAAEHFELRALCQMMRHWMNKHGKVTDEAWGDLDLIAAELGRLGFEP